MPQTLFDKIWQSHLVARRADGRDLIYIDRHVMHDLHTPHALAQLDKQQRPVRRPGGPISPSRCRTTPSRASPAAPTTPMRKARRSCARRARARRGTA